MNLLRKLFTSKKSVDKKENTEEVYYQKLFIKNARWNTAEPNEEERKRWDIIERFVLHVKNNINAKENAANPRILDLGCGRGWLSNKLSTYGTVTGIEPVSQVVEYGKTLFPHLDLRAATSKDLLKDNVSPQFDIVVCSEVIEHVPDEYKTDFINDIKKLLKPQGHAIITTPRKDVQQEWLQYCDPDQPLEEWLDEKTLNELFNAAGFNKVLLERYASAPRENAPEIEVYQLWLFQKK